MTYDPKLVEAIKDEFCTINFRKYIEHLITTNLGKPNA